MKGTDEFIKLQEQFERDIMKASGIYCYNVEREKSEDIPIGEFYTNGKTNELFKTYMLGYSYGKSEWQ